MFCQQDVYVGQGRYKHRLPKPPSGATHGRLGTRGPSDTLVRCTEFVVTELYKADVLAGLLFEQLQDSARPPHLRASSSFRPSRSALRTVLRKLFPASWFHGFRFPMIEDLVNQAPFNTFGG